jgi:hypothetical protein
MKSSVRNIVIFSVVSLGMGFLGIALDRLDPPADPMQGLGALIWLASPLLAVILLRLLGGDGWSDFGLRLNLKQGWKWYFVGVAIPVVVTALLLGLAAVLGAVSAPKTAAWGSLVPLVGAGFAAAMVKNIFEEFSWRGYLHPRLAALGLHPFANALLTGFVWAGWHVPYYLYYLDPAVLAEHTSLSPLGIILLSFAILPFHALAYGELRQLSGSTWAAWLMHNTANALSLTLISGGFITLSGGLAGLLLSPGTEGILHSLLMGLVGLGLYFYRKQKFS